MMLTVAAAVVAVLVQRVVVLVKHGYSNRSSD